MQGCGGFPLSPCGHRLTSSGQSCLKEDKQPLRWNAPEQRAAWPLKRARLHSVPLHLSESKWRGWGVWGGELGKGGGSWGDAGEASPGWGAAAQHVAGQQPLAALDFLAWHGGTRICPWCFPTGHDSGCKPAGYHNAIAASLHQP